MPAQSPTLSPTLSAMTAGLRGSSSGMPASTLPTRSAPTSAAFVKMPPPRRAKTEISEPPKPRPMSASTASRGSLVEERREDAVVRRDAEQRQADDEHAGDGAAAERGLQRRRDAAAGGLGDAGVGPHRDVHADEAGRAGQDAADQEADRHVDVLQEDQDDEQHQRDAGDDGVLAVQVGARALLDRAGDLLHPLVARRQRQQLARGHRAVDHGERRADERDDDAVVSQKVLQGKASAVLSRVADGQRAARHEGHSVAGRAGNATEPAGTARV